MNRVLEMLDRVEIAENQNEGITSLEVRPIWKNVDRPCVGGWGLPLEARPLAERLKRAIETGAVYTSAVIATDANGRTYVTATGPRVAGRTMNADLRRLGC